MAKYQLTKTLRFGLTKVRNPRPKYDDQGKITTETKPVKFESHRNLDDLVMRSEYNLIKRTLNLNEDDDAVQEINKQFEIVIKINDYQERSYRYVEFYNQYLRPFFKNDKKESIQEYQTEFVNKIDNTIAPIKDFINEWKCVCTKVSNIVVSKTYYKTLAHKVGFVAKKYKASELKVSTLSKGEDEQFDIEQFDRIKNYWLNLCNRTLRLIDDFNVYLDRYNKAISDPSKAHTKPSMTDFRKVFLLICNLTLDVLSALDEENISIVERDIPDSSITSFISKKENRETLLNNLLIIKDEIKKHGGNIYLGKATLNKHTANQKFNKLDDEIKKELDALRMDSFIKKFLNLNQSYQIRKEIFDKKNYIEKLDDKDISLIQQVQYFKFRRIPIAVKNGLKKYYKNDPKINQLLDNIGEEYLPQEHFKDADFNLYDYPLKTAFDFAWESLARNKFSPIANLNVVMCQEYLKNTFEVDVNNNKEFDIYSRLLYVFENLATLDYGNPTNPSENLSNIKKALEGMPMPNSSIIKPNEFESYIAKFTNWATLTKEERKNHKSNNDEVYTNYRNAKLNLTCVRGQQKKLSSSIYSSLTEKIKTIACNFGKHLATLRDYFSEEYQLNKIDYCAVIIEAKDKYTDSNSSTTKKNKKKNQKNPERIFRYLLIQKKENAQGITTGAGIFEPNGLGELKMYQVNSLTSKALKKITEHSNLYPEFFTLYEDNKILKWPALKPSNNKIGLTEEDKEICFAERFVILKKCLKESIMAQKQNWNTFLGWNFDHCKTVSDIEKVVDQKAYGLTNLRIGKKDLEIRIKNGAVLLPIVNQNLTAAIENDTNQFSKDWNKIFDRLEPDYRLHPEFSLFYRMPTPDYTKPGLKRYSRFQVNTNFVLEFVPTNDDYVSRKEQIVEFNSDKKDRKNDVSTISTNVRNNIGNEFHVIGIDRGVNELATMCILDNNGVIIGNHNIYNRRFDESDSNNKHWDYHCVCQRDILDLSNLKLETAKYIDGQKLETPIKVLVDLSQIKVKANKTEIVPTKNNQQVSKLEQLSFMRKFQYKFENSETREQIWSELKDCPQEEIAPKIISKKLISGYKTPNNFDNLPVDDIIRFISDYKQIIENDSLSDTAKESEIIKLCELDACDKLKSGIVANMIGIVSYFIEKYDYKVFISLENLCNAYGNYYNSAKIGLTGENVKTYHNKDYDFKEIENLELAGVGTYRFFEMQLLKKLLKIQAEKSMQLIPSFRSVQNYEQIVRWNKSDDEQYTNYPFGIVNFVEPRNTSKKCPVCGCTDVKRHKEEPKFLSDGNFIFDELECHQCGYFSVKQHFGLNKNQKGTLFTAKPAQKAKYDSKNIQAIKTCDDNAAYNIALKTLENILKFNK